MTMCVFAYYLRIRVVWAPKKSRKNYRRHHLKKMFLSVLLRICVFVFKSKKSQPKDLLITYRTILYNKYGIFLGVWVHFVYPIT
jgi:hypothetical protein